jgi:SAM-dependent methyltransferase
VSEEDAPDWSRPVDVTRREILRGLLSRFRPGRLIDLACGTGMFAVLAADLGWQVTAADARARPWADTRITWLEQDVRDVDMSGFDLILCLGIFYHLELPDQLALLKKAAPVPVIIDTHVGTPDAGEGGFAGRYYPEPPGILSSFGNGRSFWPTLESLRAMLAGAGYGLEVIEPWYHGEDRTFFVATQAAA